MCSVADTPADAGRVWFTAPGLFECSLSLTGTRDHEGWFFGHMTFLFTIGGDATGTQGQRRSPVYCIISFICFAEFPRQPTQIVRQFITEEADVRLGKYRPLPPDTPLLPPGVPPKATLPPDVVDAPLVRLFNFLREQFIHTEYMNYADGSNQR